MAKIPCEYSGGVSSVIGLTFNSAITNPLNSTIYKDDSYVYGCVMGIASSDFSANTVLVSGLPKPITGILAMRMPILISSNDSKLLPKSGIAELDSNGNITTVINTVNAATHWITINFMYKYA